MSEVVIYNLGGVEVLGKVSLAHAIKMLARGVARVHTAVEGETFGYWERPAAVELVAFVYAKWVWSHTGKVPYTKGGVLRRDKHRCAYCGQKATTMDHVVPRCQGGQSEWLNAVAACSKCNNKKAGRTPEQARMPLKVYPFVPTLADVYPYNR